MSSTGSHSTESHPGRRGIRRFMLDTRPLRIRPYRRLWASTIVTALGSQLTAVGSLRQHRAVVNLERTNLAELSRQLVPAKIDIVTADLSYVSLTRAVPQLNDRVAVAPAADLIALIKPQFELGLSEPPTEAPELARAVQTARTGVEQAGWEVKGTAESPARGTRGAIEFLLHALRRQD